MTDVVVKRGAEVAAVSAELPAPRRRERGRRLAGRGWVRWLLAGVYVVVLFWGGVRLRTWCWDTCDHIHFLWDMNNALNWGRQMMDLAHHLDDPKTTKTYRDPVSVPKLLRAFVHFYDHVEDVSHGENYNLDYVPGRLLIVSLWVRQIYATYPDANGWKPEYAPPMLAFNYFMEILAAIGAFLLARHWAIRTQIPPPPRLAWRTRFDWLLGGKVPTRKAPAEKAPGSAGGSNAKRAHMVAQPPGRAGSFGSFGAPAVPINYTRALIIGLAAATFFWLNPAVIVEAHGWPQWDIWAVPGFLWAAWAASSNRFFLAGLCVVASAMFKGQILFVALLFILWPLFEGRPGAATRFVLGLLTTFGVLMTPWLVVQGELPWLVTVFIATLGAAWLVYLRSQTTRPRLRQVLFWVSVAWAPVTVGLIVWPWIAQPWLWWAGALLAVLLAAAPFMFKRKAAPYIAAAGFCGAVFIGALIYEGSFAWWTVGYFYATHHYLSMTVGPASNVAMILDRRYGWHLFDHVFTLSLPATRWLVMESVLVLLAVLIAAVVHGMRVARQAGGRRWPRLLGAGVAALLASGLLVDQLIGAHVLGRLIELVPNAIDFQMKPLLITVYVITLLLACVGMALQHRRNDPRFLIAITAPWILMFTFLPQMHERYLLFGAAATCVVIAVDLGFALLHVVLSAFTFFMVLGVMLESNHVRGELGKLLHSIQSGEPDIGWAILIIALVWLYVALRPRRKLDGGKVTEEESR